MSVTMRYRKVSEHVSDGWPTSARQTVVRTATPRRIRLTLLLKDKFVGTQQRLGVLCPHLMPQLLSAFNKETQP